jgi:hypothetical protein
MFWKQLLTKTMNKSRQFLIQGYMPAAASRKSISSLSYDLIGLLAGLSLLNVSVLTAVLK